MKTLLSYFRMHFVSGLQYRAAAWAGVSTQFAWGGMFLLMYHAFYSYNAAAFPMPFASLSTYIWLQQGLLMLFSAWVFDNDIFEGIISGGVAYELCRPVNLYAMWFTRTLAARYSRVLLRMVPLFLVTVFIPAPYGLGAPVSLAAFLVFLLSLLLGSLVMAAFSMLIYLSTFYTLSAIGMRFLFVSVVEFASGALIPLPFFPERVQAVLSLLPFASTSSTPFLIYVGYYTGGGIGQMLLLQCFWLAALTGGGLLLMRHALSRVVVQGG